MSLTLGIVYAYFSMIKKRAAVRVEVYILLIDLPVKP